MNYTYKTQDALYRSLKFLIEATKTEPGMRIYKAHIERAEKAIKDAENEHKAKDNELATESEQIDDESKAAIY